MIATAVRRFGGLLAALAIMGTLAVGLCAPSAQAAVASQAAPTAIVTPKSPAFNPLCSIDVGGISSILCNKLVEHAIGTTVGGIVGKAATGAVNHAVGQVAGSVGDSFLQGMNQAVQAGAQYILSAIAKAVGGEQTPNLQSTWFFGMYDKMLTISLILLGLMVSASILIAAATLNGRRLIETGKALVLGVLVAFGMPFFLQVLLLLSDEIAAAITGHATSSGSTFPKILSDLLTQMNGNGAIPIGVSLTVMIFVCVGAGLLFIELLVRSVSLYAGLLFASLAFSTRAIGEWGQRLSGSLMRYLLALIFGLPLIVGILDLGNAILANLPPVPGVAIAKPVLGAVVLGLAILSPLAMVSWVRQLSVSFAHARLERAAAHGESSNVSPATGAARAETQIREIHVTAEQASSGDPGVARRAVGTAARVLENPVVVAGATVVAGPEAGAGVAAAGAVARSVSEPAHGDSAGKALTAANTAAAISNTSQPTSSA